MVQSLTVPSPLADSKWPVLGARHRLMTGAACASITDTSPSELTHLILKSLKLQSNHQWITLDCTDYMKIALS